MVLSMQRSLQTSQQSTHSRHRIGHSDRRSDYCLDMRLHSKLLLTVTPSLTVGAHQNTHTHRMLISPSFEDVHFNGYLKECACRV